MQVLEVEVLVELLFECGDDVVCMFIFLVVNDDLFDIWFVLVIVDLYQCYGYLFDLCMDDQDYILQLLCDGSVFGVVIVESQLVKGCNVYLFGVMCYYVIVLFGFVCQYFSDGMQVVVLVCVLMLVFNCKDEL